MYKDQETLLIKDLEYSQSQLDLLFDQKEMREFFFNLPSKPLFQEKVDFIFESIWEKKEDIYLSILFNVYENKDSEIAKMLKAKMNRRFLKQILIFEIEGEIRVRLLSLAIKCWAGKPNQTLKEIVVRLVEKICSNNNWEKEIVDIYFSEIYKDPYLIETMSSKITHYLTEELVKGTVDFGIAFFYVSYNIIDNFDPLESKELDYAYHKLITNEELFPKVKEILEENDSDKTTSIYQYLYHFVKEACVGIAIEIGIKNPSKYTFKQAFRLAISKFMADLKKPGIRFVFQEELKLFLNVNE